MQSVFRLAGAANLAEQRQWPRSATGSLKTLCIIDLSCDFHIINPMETIKSIKNSEESVKRQSSPIPLPVERAIRKIGNDISLARRRRHISQESLAERTGASISTIRRLEKGDIRVPIHFFARVLHVFGELDALAKLLDTAQDEIGLTLMDEQLPQRVRKMTSKRNNTGAL